jgi:hypothetical protein
MNATGGRLYGPLGLSLAMLLLALSPALGVLVLSSAIGPFRLLAPQAGPRALAGLGHPVSMPRSRS